MGRVIVMPPPKCRGCGRVVDVGRTDRGELICLKCWNRGGRGFAWERLT